MNRDLSHVYHRPGELFWLECDPFQAKVPCWQRRYTTPAWLRERVNDPCGTPNRHAFWLTVAFTDKGNWRTFERDSYWYAFDRLHNAWYHFPTVEEMNAHMAKQGCDIDEERRNHARENQAGGHYALWKFGNRAANGC